MSLHETIEAQSINDRSEKSAKDSGYETKTQIPSVKLNSPTSIIPVNYRSHFVIRRPT